MNAIKNFELYKLQKGILQLEGYRTTVLDNVCDIGFKPIENAFPNKNFPIGSIHEFLSLSIEDVSATSGFVSGVLSKLMHLGGVCMWISSSRTIFPAALKSFGINPDKIIFIDLKNERDVLYAMDEALKCDKLISVVCELKNINFKESRRLQLAVEQSRVTGFIIRNQPRILNTIACIARWRITSLPSELNDGMPGVGFPRWNVELLKARNGKPGSWKIEWSSNSFKEIKENVIAIPQTQIKMLDSMNRRFVAIWFRHLKTDWMIYRKPELKDEPFVLALPDHGRMRITEVSSVAKTKGLYAGMVVADAKVVIPDLHVIDDDVTLADKLLKKICLYCIRFTPISAIDTPDGLLLDVTGCAHLWGSEQLYLKAIINKIKSFGFHVRAAMADTIGAAWAVCRYGKVKAIINPDEHKEAIMSLPPAALRLEANIIERLQKLGLYQINSFIGMQRSALRRRFGQQLLLKLDQALGYEEEFIQPLEPLEPYSERLPCLEPIQTATGIEIALQRLLEMLCKRLQQEGKGLRVALLKCYRIDGKTEDITIRTNHASNSVKHLFKLFELKITTIEPALGIELFTLEASKVEDIIATQETFWNANGNLESAAIGELLDHFECKFGNNIIHRYLPDEHHLPERSIKLATSLKEKPTAAWKEDKLRPIQLLHQPQPIEVTAPIPDYPPMNFRYKGKLHTIKKADACERIEAEWWLTPGLHRDYYIVEHNEGKRYWLFRLGHYTADKTPSWFIHGFFA